jgi:CubicO group peptidase (beta-lactamase class C family)
MNLKKIETKLNRYFLKDKLIGLSAGIYKDGEEHFINIGSFDKENSKPVSADTLFEIGSITKTITASALSILNERNTIDLHAPIKTYLSDKYSLSSCFDNVTPYRLLTHTSGLPRLPDEFISIMENNMEDPYACISKQNVIAYLEAGEFNNRNATYAYSNLGFGILGFLVEHILKKDFYSIAKELVFENLQMNDTTVLGLNNHLSTATGHDFSGKPTPFWKDDALAACGCFISSTNDMMKFLKTNIISGYSNISNEIQKTHSSQEKKTGLAWHYQGWISKLAGFGSFIWHNGMTGGCSSYMTFSKKHQSGFILLSNKQVILDEYYYYLAGHLK